MRHIFRKPRRPGRPIPPPSRQDGDKPVQSDVLGSYTGVPSDGGTPVQDADDL